MKRRCNLPKAHQGNRLEFALDFYLEMVLFTACRDHESVMQKTIPQFNVHEAKSNLSRLIEMAIRGEPFIIARAGKPVVIVRAYEPPPDPARRVGFLKGRYSVPADFDSMGREEIRTLFEGA